MDGYGRKKKNKYIAWLGVLEKYGVDDSCTLTIARQAKHAERVLGCLLASLNWNHAHRPIVTSKSSMRCHLVKLIQIVYSLEKKNSLHQGFTNHTKGRENETLHFLGLLNKLFKS